MATTSYADPHHVKVDLGEGLPKGVEFAPSTPPLRLDKDRIIVLALGKTKGLSELRATAKALADRWQECQHAIDDSGDVDGKLQAARDTVARKLASGEKLTGEPLPSRAALLSDLEQMKISAVTAQKAIGEQTAQFVVKNFPPLISIIEAWINQQLQAEQDIYTRCTVPYPPERSPLRGALLDVLTGLQKRLEHAKSGAQHDYRPGSVLGFLLLP